MFPNIVDVAIVGAGPYGLSLAAHLREAGISFRIFGKPMSTWRNHMPKGMCLKSEGFASNLSAPDKNSTLEAWCAATGKEYSAQKIPVAVEDFVAYADWFTRTYVPTLEILNVTNIVRGMDGYWLTLEDGARVEAARVVMAVGITWFKNLPEALAGLPAAAVSHSFDHHDCSRVQGKRRDSAGRRRLGRRHRHRARRRRCAGADRRPPQGHPLPRRTRQRRAVDLPAAADPDTGIGPGWRSFFCTQMPLVFHKLPQSMRLEITRRHLGPAPGWFTREKVEGKIPTHLGQHLHSAPTWSMAVSRWSWKTSTAANAS